MILVDYMGHMVSTESAEELHTFAKKLGLKRKWYQTPAVSKTTGKISKRGSEHCAHYDLTTGTMILKAVRTGAREVEPAEIIKQAWWR